MRKSGPDLDVLRNEAVAAWIHTFPVDDRLEAFLDRVPASMRDEIRQSAKVIYAAASAFLETSAERGDIELDDFYPTLHKHLQARFPWMRDAAFGALRAYTGWYSWHEGYLANGRDGAQAVLARSGSARLQRALLSAVRHRVR